MDYLPREIRIRWDGCGDGRCRLHVPPMIPKSDPEICVWLGRKEDCKPISILQGLCQVKTQPDKKISQSIHTK